MPASYSQRSAQLRADRQAKAGWSSIGDNPDMFIIDGDGNVRLKEAQGFDLPDLAPGNEEWVSDVVLWWTSLRYSPQALLLNTGVAWATALVAAGALNTYYVTGMAPYLSQWRSLTSGFGLTQRTCGRSGRRSWPPAMNRPSMMRTPTTKLMKRLRRWRQACNAQDDHRAPRN